MDENLAKFKEMIYEDYPEDDEELTLKTSRTCSLVRFVSKMTNWQNSV